MTGINFIIAVLAGCSAGIFAWLFLVRFYDRLDQFRQSYTETTATRLSELFFFIDINKYFGLYVGLVLVVPVAAWLLSGRMPVGFAVFCILLFAPHLLLTTLRNRRLKSFERQLPDALLMLSGSLRAGASLSQAMDVVIQESPPPLSQEFSLFVRERRLGVELDSALDHLEARMQLEDLSMLLSAIRISREVGGNLADTLDNLADTLRRKQVMEGKIDSLTAQGRLQGIVMSMLPLFLIVVLMKLEPAAMGLMFTTRTGWMVFALILVLQTLGFLSIQKITKIDV